IFGVGMVLSGGCASGSQYKIGEGNGTSVLAILGISFGQAIFVDFSWFDDFFRRIVQNPQITLAKTELISAIAPGNFKYFLGNSLINTIIPSLLIIILIYYGYMRKGFLKKRKKAKESLGFKADLAGIMKMITASKKTSLMGVLIGITAGVHIFTMKGMQNRFGIDNFGELLSRMGHTADLSSTGRVFDPGYWYITTQEAQFAGWVLEKFGWNMHDNIFFGVINGIPELWRNPALWMSLGIIFGAMVLALLNKEFKLKLPKGELIIWGLGGGLLMGIGARIALGCNIGAFFIRVAGGDPGGWLFGIGMVIGGYGGVKFFNWWTDRKIAAEMENF
ncbi:MAG: YeeE/YedE family protein, partial [SAR324 cluster bacterium]|nr:YeeE/YedE family protein [SAR324 cluster bacterium]